MCSTPLDVIVVVVVAKGLGSRQPSRRCSQCLAASSSASPPRPRVGSDATQIKIGLLSRICGWAKRHLASFSSAFQRFSTSLEAVLCRSQKSRPENEAFSGINSDLPSRLHLRFALNLLGRSEGEGGRGDPPVEPEPSLAADFAPTDSAEEPNNLTRQIRDAI
jgi:hypothetical protein